MKLKKFFIILLLMLLYILISSKVLIACGNCPQKSCSATSDLPTAAGPPASQIGLDKTITEVGYSMDEFLSFTNKLHPENRIGYRLLENVPIIYGNIPIEPLNKAAIEKTEKLEKQFSALPGVYVRKVNVTELTKKPWTPQTWTFYIVPVADGFELLWVIETKDTGLNQYYVAQQCFRMGGSKNRPWRRTIAQTPAFSEYELWDLQNSHSLPKTSLSFVRRNGRWQPMPATKNHIVYRTPLGHKMDTARSGGNLSKVPHLEPKFRPRTISTFEPDIDCGLATRCNLENTWVCALYWENTTHISNHHPADCLHAFVNLGPLPANSKKAIRGRIYWTKASKDQLFASWLKNLPSD